MIKVFLIQVYLLVSSVALEQKDQSELNSSNQVNKSKFNGTTQLTTLQFITNNKFFLILLFLNFLVVIVGFVIILRTIKAMLKKASNYDSNLMEFTNETEFIYI